jgi:hypothetical protein
MYQTQSAIIAAISGRYTKSMYVRASSGCWAFAGINMLSVHSTAPSSGTTNRKSGKPVAFSWKMSPDQAWQSQTSPRRSAPTYRWS